MDAPSSEWAYAEMSVHASESETEEEEDKKKRGPSSLCRSMASLHEKMRFGGRHGHTSQDTTKDPLAASFEDTSLLNSHGIPNGRDAGATFEGCHKNSAESQVPEPSAGGGQRKGVQPHTARKMARNAAVFGAMVLAPVQCLMNQISQASGHRLH